MEFATIVDPDDAAQNELPQLSLFCLTPNVLNNLEETLLFFLNLADFNLSVFYFGALKMD